MPKARAIERALSDGAAKAWTRHHNLLSVVTDYAIVAELAGVPYDGLGIFLTSFKISDSFSPTTALP